ncbi:hypothetical protein JSY14_03795 [Brachybacterium sp. EF45031]|uniref:hypothetical protein n=1 Tax=Brachybacterium sillae TaxID=2810536 RepID=UPI00217E6ACA|nr:hypothetical protein [Brachybacterium sillae]MCS6711179.1 hypothetical protein [Brachybacterium sillae]
MPMQTVAAVVVAGPSEGEGFTTTSVTPGVAGAITALILAAAVLLLAMDMTRRIRRLQARQRIEAKLDAEEAAEREAAEREAAERESAARGDDGAVDPSRGADPRGEAGPAERGDDDGSSDRLS